MSGRRAPLVPMVLLCAVLATGYVLFPGGDSTPQNDTDSTEMAETVAGITLVQQRPVFTAYWPLSARELYATSRDQLYHSGDGGEHWEGVIELPEGSEWLRFDGRGQRGYAGSPWELQVTLDGGSSWHEIKPSAIFDAEAGAKLSDQLNNFTSAIYLDLESGAGSFTAGGAYFATRDYGKSWSIHTVENRPGKWLPVSDSPFALDLEAGLAVIDSPSNEMLFERQESGQWVVNCMMDELMAAIAEQTLCDESSEPAIQRFMARYDSLGAMLPWGQEPTDLPALASGGGNGLAEPVVQQAGAFSWVAVPEGLALQDGEGGPWEVRFYTPAWLQTVYPLSAGSALGLTDEQAYFSSDAGQSWWPVPAASGYIESHWFQQRHNRLWAVDDGRLWSLEAAVQATWQEVPQVEGVAEFAAIGHDASGEAIWVESDYGYHISVDGGDHWAALSREALGEGEEIGLSHLACWAGQPACVVLLEDGRLLPLSLAAGEVRAGAVPRATLPEGVEWVDGLVANGERIIAVDSERSQLLIRDEGDGPWQSHPYAAEGEIVRYDVNLNGHVVFSGYDFLLIGHNFGADWRVVEPAGLQDVELLCADRDLGQLTVRGYTRWEEDEQLAVSHDAGESWESEEVEGGWCGSANGYLWRRDHNLSIYRWGNN